MKVGTRVVVVGDYPNIGTIVSYLDKSDMYCVEFDGHEGEGTIVHQHDLIEYEDDTL